MESLSDDIRVLYFFQGLSEEIQSELSKGAEGFTPTEIDVLLNLGAPLRMKELAKAIFCKPSNVTVLVDKLEADGLLERKRSAEDRRVIDVTLTAKGTQSRKKVITKIESVIKEKSILDDNDYAQIMKIITKRKSKR